jgi:AcrR family transcriptional regulator
VSQYYIDRVADVKSSRRDRSAATRLKIMRAAEAEFLAKGFHGATIASIAEQAGVASQTVYFVFHNKAALISAVLDNAVLGDAEPTVPQESAWWAAAAAEPRAAEALRIIIRGSAPIFARASPIVQVLRAAARTDAELRELLHHHQQLRYDGFRQVIEMLTTKGRLKAGLDVAAAAAIFWTIYSEGTYELLTDDRRWTHERVIEWLCDALPGLLLEQ